MGQLIDMLFALAIGYIALWVVIFVVGGVGGFILSILESLG